MPIPAHPRRRSEQGDDRPASERKRQAALAERDYALVLEHVTQILELDPDNQQALDLKRQADAAAEGEKTTTYHDNPMPAVRRS